MNSNNGLTDKIAVIDAGGQYSHLIARRVRELKVLSEIHPNNVIIEKLKDYKGIILSGGPYSVYEEGSPPIDKRIFEIGIPVLGICYGHQIMAKLLDGVVKRGNIREYGLTKIELKNNNHIFNTLPKFQTVWMSHQDQLEKLPLGFSEIGSSNNCKFAAIMDDKRKLYGLQFHPEVSHTEHGLDILKNFVVHICQCNQNWKHEDLVKSIEKEIRNKVKGGKVFFLVSGGVDSMTAYTLTNKALNNKNVYGLYVDTGFMRKGDKEKIKTIMKEMNFKNLDIYDATKEFFKKLKNIFDPEEKRKIIGRLFFDIQDTYFKELANNSNDWYLGQGTIYPDTIESGGTKNSSLIKTHHNRVDKINELIKQNKVLEPLRNLYKDEVRKIATFSSLSEEIAYSHPFPGPGLAIRCLCSKTRSDYENIPNVSNIASKHNLKAYVYNLKSVGVKGDQRSYGKTVVLDSKEFPGWGIIGECSTNITNQEPQINRVAFLINIKEGYTLDNSKVKKASITKKRVDILREVDYLCRQWMSEYDIWKNTWQFPIVLLPIFVGKLETVVLRPVISEDGMTAQFAKLDLAKIRQLSNRLIKSGLVNAVLYDVSNKPPATIEWE